MRIGMMNNNPRHFGRGHTQQTADLETIASDVVLKVAGGEKLENAMSQFIDQYKLEGLQIEILINMVNNKMNASSSRVTVLRPDTTLPIANTVQPIALARRETFLMKLAVDYHQKRINVVVLDQMVSRKEITVQEKAYILEAAAEMDKRERVEPIQAEPEISLDMLMKRYMLDREDQEIVDSLPEILGFKFCPRLGTDSGILPPLVDDFVSPEYELMYLTMIASILKEAKMILSSRQTVDRILEDEFLGSIAKKYDDNEMSYIYAALPGGLLEDKSDLNPVFARNFWLNLLGLRLDDASANSILRLKDADLVSLLESKEREAQNAIAVVSNTIAELQAQAEVEETSMDYVPEDPALPTEYEQVEQDTGESVLPTPVESDVPPPITPFYKKRSNQAMAVALTLLVGYFLMKKK